MVGDTEYYKRKLAQSKRKLKVLETRVAFYDKLLKDSIKSNQKRQLKYCKERNADIQRDKKYCKCKNTLSWNNTTGICLRCQTRRK